MQVFLGNVFKVKQNYFQELSKKKMNIIFL